MFPIVPAHMGMTTTSSGNTRGSRGNGHQLSTNHQHSNRNIWNIWTNPLTSSISSSSSAIETTTGRLHNVNTNCGSSISSSRSERDHHKQLVINKNELKFKYLNSDNNVEKNIFHENKKRCSIAKVLIEKNTKSCLFDIVNEGGGGGGSDNYNDDNLMSLIKTNSSSSSKILKDHYSVSILTNGLLQCVLSPLNSDDEIKIPEIIWLKTLKHSMDVHSNNLILELIDNNDSINNIKKLQLRTLHAIDKGEELFMWYSEEILALIDIPFLTPANIRGKNSYTCHLCEKSYENPNPLKIHMVTKCDGESQNQLWTKLSLALSRRNYEMGQLQRLSQQQSSSSSSPPRLSNYQQILEQPQRKESRPHKKHKSAFQPVLAASSSSGKYQTELSPSISPPSPTPSSSSSSITPISPITPTQSYFPSNIQQLIPSHHYHQQQFEQHLHHQHHHLHHLQLQQQQHHLQHQVAHLQHHHPLPMSSPSTTTTPPTISPEIQTANAAAAHLETIVSNMGTSKQGHLCIYCGKVYSRKYGLKIHIRTHTGFKPLKCKYCFRPFGDPSNLNKHVRLHVQGNTIYKCPECDKILIRRRDLQRHIQSRHTLNLLSGSRSGGGGGGSSGCSSGGRDDNIMMTSGDNLQNVYDEHDSSTNSGKMSICSDTSSQSVDFSCGESSSSDEGTKTPAMEDS